jgi:hypothetical protein
LPPEAESATVSTSVFQAPQPGHLPSQRGLVPPQALQVKVVFSLAMGGNYTDWHGRQLLLPIGSWRQISEPITIKSAYLYNCSA